MADIYMFFFEFVNSKVITWLFSSHDYISVCKWFFYNKVHMYIRQSNTSNDLYIYKS